MRLALFDLDGTLLADDTQLLFHHFVKRRQPWRQILLPLQLGLMPLSLTHVLTSRELKQLFHSYLTLMPREELEALADEFVQTVVQPLLYPEMRQEIERHRGEGRVLVLNSASPELWVRKIGALLGFDHSIGTRLVVPNGLMPLVPEIDGPNNKREAKLPPMASLGLLPCDPDDSWAYSDSVVDLPMLDLVTHAVLVNPNPSLTAHGVQRGWQIHRPARPWKQRAGRVWRTIKLLGGLSLEG